MATVTFMRGGDGDLSQKVVVSYIVSGNLLGGNDYVTLTGTKKIKPGQASASLRVVPLGGGGNGKLILKVAPGVGYTAGDPGKVKVKITD